MSADTGRYNARFKVYLEDRPWVRHIRVMAEQTVCPECERMVDVYARQDMPELPVWRCTRQGGCACWYAALAPEPPAPPVKRRRRQRVTATASAVGQRAD